MHFCYLDEFGHIGPYVAVDHPCYNTSPVFGLAGLILPAEQVRSFSTWFFQRKQDLLEFEITRSGKHPAEWEKKGSSLYTTQNIRRYSELRHFTNRFLNKIDKCGGRVIYVGMKKTASPSEHNSQRIYKATLRETLKRLDQYCQEDCAELSRILVFMDEHQERDAFVKEASQSMFNSDHPLRHLVEPPVQVESHRYQTMQAADWICGLIGRLGAHWANPTVYSEFAWAKEYFEQRLLHIQVRSGIRNDRARDASVSASQIISLQS